MVVCNFMDLFFCTTNYHVFCIVMNLTSESRRIFLLLFAKPIDMVCRKKRLDVTRF